MPSRPSPSILPSGFTFSQASLQDYAACARRFQLRYILQVRWPMSGDEPAARQEQRIQQGAAFHYLVHQHAVGIPVASLGKMASQDMLQRWWKAYLTTPPAHLPRTVHLTEVRLVTPFGNHRLMARYDLLAIDPGQRAVIVDWKTGTKRPTRTYLEKRWQTLVYRYVLVESGQHLNTDAPIRPEQVEMVYWFADFPAQPERFGYSAQEHAATAQSLVNLIGEIETGGDHIWPLANDERQCRYCTFRTLCDRVGEPSVETAEELETDSDDLYDLELDYDQVVEVAF